MRTMAARETTVNVRASHTEKQVWQQAALDAGYSHHENGAPVGSVSKWLRALAEAATAGGKPERMPKSGGLVMPGTDPAGGK